MAARRWRRTIALGASVLVVALWWSGTAAHAPVAAAHPASAYGAGVALARAVPPRRATVAAPEECQALPRAVSARRTTFAVASVALVTPTIAPSPTVTPTATAVTPPRGGTGSSRPAAALLWGWVVAALLILVLLGVGLYVLRRMR